MGIQSTLPEHLLSKLKDIERRTEGAEAQAVHVGRGPRAPRRFPRRSRVSSFALLDEYLEEAKTGAPDEWLARATNVALTTVLEWRRERGIRREKEHKAVEGVFWAVDMFGDREDSYLHRAETSPIAGRWEPPEFVLRRPLRYAELCRHLHYLTTRLGTGSQLLAEAFGFKETDIDLAVEIWDAHLRKKGAPCATCERLTDPIYGAYCSNACRGSNEAG